jgi:Holliday junction resolvase-like predicted endonuclease
MGTPRGWKQQGDLGEVSALQWLTFAGALVSKPLFESPDYDLVADFDGRLVRVQVKTSVRCVRERFVVSLATRGGNQSWSRTIKYLGPERCDWVFVHVGDGRRWCIPTTALGGRSAICVAGPKYAEFEVDPGHPLPHFVETPPSEVSLDSPAPAG